MLWLGMMQVSSPMISMDMCDTWPRQCNTPATCDHADQVLAMLRHFTSVHGLNGCVV
jgi:hypothetical protein